MMLIFDISSTKEYYERLFASPVGTVFEVSPEDFETVMLRIESYRPDNMECFEVVPIVPGTSLYTQYGSDHCVITRFVLRS